VICRIFRDTHSTVESVFFPLPSQPRPLSKVLFPPFLFFIRRLFARRFNLEKWGVLLFPYPRLSKHQNTYPRKPLVSLFLSFSVGLLSFVLPFQQSTAANHLAAQEHARSEGKASTWSVTFPLAQGYCLSSHLSQLPLAGVLFRSRTAHPSLLALRSSSRCHSSVLCLNPLSCARATVRHPFF